MSGELSPSRYRRQIEAALKYTHGSHTFDDVCELVAQGKLQFWPGPHSVIMTEILQFPRYRAVNFFLAGGVMEELMAMEPRVLDWAKTQGCTRAVLSGRKGWERSFLTRTGWEVQELVVLEKSLDGEERR